MDKLSDVVSITISKEYVGKTYYTHGFVSQ